MSEDATSDDAEPSWLAERSVPALRAALGRLRPDLAGAEVRFDALWVDTGNPLWSRGTAYVGDHHVVKFAWSAPAATKLWREIRVQRLLASSGTVPTAPLATWSHDPVLLVRRFVPGGPMTWDGIAGLDSAEVDGLGARLAAVLGAMHAPAMLAAARGAGLDLPPPTPQADTTALRERLAARLDGRRRALVVRWCDGVDAALAGPAPVVLLHGDFHGYNLVVRDGGAVAAVLDLEEASAGDPHYDFRYLPAQAASPALTLATARAYERLTGQPVSMRRVLAWTVRTVLGDALWRTEAAVALPGGGTAQRWIDEMADRLVAFGVAL